MRKLFSMLVLMAMCLFFFTACEGLDFGSSKKSKYPISGTHNGHDYVDLGLPSGLLWATCNIGATTPKEYGDYFAWGEVEPKETYNWSTYKYGTGYDQLTKYCDDSSYGKDGFTDNKTVLDLEDDAAHVNWGGAWRMPTEYELWELCTECKLKRTTLNGAKGYKVTGPNGNSIFLPAAGYMGEGTLYDAGSRPYYWSNWVEPGQPDFAYGFDLGFVTINSNRRCTGRSVRPVCQ